MLKAARQVKPLNIRNAAGLVLFPLSLCFVVSGCAGTLHVHIAENLGKRAAAADETPALPNANWESDQSAKVKLLLAGEAAPWDGVLITRFAFEAMVDAANGKSDGLETRPTR